MKNGCFLCGIVMEVGIGRMSSCSGVEVIILDFGSQNPKFEASLKHHLRLSKKVSGIEMPCCCREIPVWKRVNCIKHTQPPRISFAKVVMEGVKCIFVIEWQV